MTSCCSEAGATAESEIGVLKPKLGHGWGIPRSHGLVEHVCMSAKRQQVATVIRPSPRNKHALLCIWALEGPHLHQVHGTFSMLVLCVFHPYARMATGCTIQTDYAQ